ARLRRAHRPRTRDGAGPRARGVGRRSLRLPLGGDRGRDRHRVRGAQRLPVRPLRVTAVPDLGTVALEDAPRVDFTRLRAQRRSRCLEAMERHGLDVLVLGRDANARYVAGARRLWTAGTRAFAPTCVLVRATGDVHLLSTWDDGIPEEIPRE